MNTPSAPSTAVILNPQSGSALAPDVLIAQVALALPGAEIFTGTQAGHAERDARRAAEAGFGTIIAAGGDGTLNEVLNGLLPHADRLRLGLLPLGTGNDFARALAMPTKIEDALAVLAAGATRPLDVIRISHGAVARHFINVSAGGFSGAVSEKMTSDLKAAWGPLSYLRGMIEAWPELAPFQCELTFDDEPPTPLTLFNLVIANASHVARGIPMAPDADPGDGFMDVVAIREIPVSRMALLAPLVLTGNHLESEDVYFRRARKLAVHATPPMPFNTDGELIGESPWLFEVLPQAIAMIVPAAV